MKIQDAATIMATAIVTAVAVITVLGIPNLNAVDPPAKQERHVANVANERVEYRLVLNKPSYQVGEKVSGTLIVRNLTDKMLTVPLNVRLTNQGLWTAMTRSANLPLPLWQHKLELTFGPKETRRVTLAPDKALIGPGQVSLGVAETTGDTSGQVAPVGVLPTPVGVTALAAWADVKAADVTVAVNNTQPSVQQ